MNDFCYLCFQREKRNLPIYYTEERKKNEQEEDNLLQMYTMLKDSEAIKKEEVKKYSILVISFTEWNLQRLNNRRALIIMLSKCCCLWSILN